MTQWLIRESSTGLLYQLATNTDDTEQVYRIFGRQMYGMTEDFDTANVDIDLFKLPQPLGTVGTVMPVEGEV